MCTTRPFPEDVQTEMCQGQSSAVPVLKLNMTLFFLLNWNLLHTFSHVLCLGRAPACDANKKSWQYIQANSTFSSLSLHKIKCRYQSHVLLAVWELISLNPMLHPCQLAGLLEMTHFLTGPCQWVCLSEIPSHVCSLPKWYLSSYFWQIRHTHLSI